jgi:hypothetical protein
MSRLKDVLRNLRLKPAYKLAHNDVMLNITLKL